MRIVGNLLRSSMGVMVLCLALSANLFAQAAHVAVCQTASGPPKSNNTSLISKVAASLGDPHAVASLKAIRYTGETSAGTSASAASVKVIETHIYPDHVVLITQVPGGLETHLEASPAGAFMQVPSGWQSLLHE